MMGNESETDVRALAERLLYLASGRAGSRPVSSPDLATLAHAYLAAEQRAEALWTEVNRQRAALAAAEAVICCLANGDRPIPEAGDNAWIAYNRVTAAEQRVVEVERLAAEWREKWAESTRILDRSESDRGALRARVEVIGNHWRIIRKGGCGENQWIDACAAIDDALPPQAGEGETR